MRDLKVLGAHNINPGRNPGLTGRRALKTMMEAYERFRQQDGLLPATYEVIYGHAWRAEGERPARTVPSREFIVSIDEMKGKG
jgi:malonyl-CoA O-methyltransferase